MSGTGGGRAAAAATWLSPQRFASLLALLLVAWLPDVVFGGRSFFYRDFGVLAYPSVSYAHESFWRGELPLWNPLSHCGVPFLAQWGTMVLYPGTLWYLLLPLPWSLNSFCLAHLWLAGLGMYSLARRWTGSSVAAAIAGAAFVFNGVTQSCLLWPNYAVALGWMPWVVLLVERAQAEGRRSVVFAAVAAAMQLLAGVPELVGMTWLILGAFWLARIWALRPPDDLTSDQQWPTTTALPAEHRAVSGRGVAAARSGLVLSLALGLSAAQLFPFADLLLQSQRVGGVDAAKWALPAWGIGNFLVPLFHCYRNAQGLFFQPGQEFFSSVYLGGVLLALGVFAVARRRDLRVWLLAGLGLLGVTMALGEASPIYRGVRAGIPFAGLARYPVKWMLLVSFAVPLLAAFGLAALPAVAGLRHPAARDRTLRTLWWSVGVILMGIGFIVGIAVGYPLATDQPQTTVLNPKSEIGRGWCWWKGLRQ